jgi:hypothetical protein
VAGFGKAQADRLERHTFVAVIAAQMGGTRRV